MASQLCRITAASDAASAIVHPLSTKQVCRSSTVTISGTDRKHSCNDGSWFPQAAAWFNIGAFSRTHVDLSDIALAVDDELRRRLRSVAGSIALGGICIVTT